MTLLYCNIKIITYHEICTYKHIYSSLDRIVIYNVRNNQFQKNVFPGSKMTISGRPEIGLEDVPWTLVDHRFDVLRTSIDPKMVQILTEILRTILKKLIFIKVLDNHLYTQKA